VCGRVEGDQRDATDGQIVVVQRRQKVAQVLLQQRVDPLRLFIRKKPNNTFSINGSHGETM
jgi:hypothetical protein